MTKPNKFTLQRERQQQAKADYHKTVKMVDLVLKLVTIVLNRELGIGRVRLERINDKLDEAIKEYSENAMVDEKYALYKIDQEFNGIMDK